MILSTTQLYPPRQEIDFQDNRIECSKIKSLKTLCPIERSGKVRVERRAAVETSLGRFLCSIERSGKVRLERRATVISSGRFLAQGLFSTKARRWMRMQIRAEERVLCH